MNKIEQIPWQEYKKAVFANINNDVANCEDFALISVSNSQGKMYSKRRNMKLAIKVKQYLNRRGIQYQEVWAGSHDMAYRERSLIIKINYCEANKIASFAKQNAFHFIRNGSVYLIPTNKIRRCIKLLKFKHHQINVPPRLLKYSANQAIAE
jgi:hypothetical protein